MTRVDLSPDVTIYHGDCLEVLPTLAGIDAVVTDPPYSSGGMYRGDRAMDTRSKYTSTNAVAKYAVLFSGDNRDQRAWQFWSVLWCSAAMHACSPGAACMLFSDWRQLPTCTDVLQGAGWVYRGIAGWNKEQSRPMADRFRQVLEFIVWGTAGGRAVNMADADYHAGLFSYPPPPPSERLHPTEKPVDLMRDLVALAEPGGLVLDPFMGSGATGIACIRTGRRFVGIEIDAHYFEVARARLERELAQPRLPLPPVPQATQPELAAMEAPR